MKIEEYLKESFADIPHLKPIDISSEVLSRLPKHNFGPFNDPLFRNAAVSISAVLLFVVLLVKFNPSAYYLQIADSHIIGIEGKAEIYKDKAWQKADANLYLPQGSVLKTNEHSFIKFELADKSNLLLQANSILELKRPFPYVEFNLIKGGLLIFAQNTSVRKSFSIFAGHIEARVLGTRFKVLIDEENIQIEVLEGKIELRDSFRDEKLVTLKQFEKADSEKQNLKSLKIRELSPPEIDSLKQELGLAKRRTTPEHLKGLLWWRELRNDESVE